MSLQKVGWEYLNGMSALINMTNLIEASIEAASLKVHQKSPMWDAKGFYINNNKLWCGVIYENPEILIFEIYDKENYDKNAIDETTYELGENKNSMWFRLPLEDIYFFSLDKDKQLEEITKFIKISYNEAQMMRVESK